MKKLKFKTKNYNRHLLQDMAVNELYLGVPFMRKLNINVYKIFKTVSALSLAVKLALRNSLCKSNRGLKSYTSWVFITVLNSPSPCRV